MQLVNSILAESETLPQIDAVGYQYVVAGNGLFIRAEDSRLAALIPIADDFTLYGLVALESVVVFKLPRIPGEYLLAIWQSARRHLPNEAMYQLRYDNFVPDMTRNAWRITMPRDLAAPTPTSLAFDDQATAVIDLHSHGAMDAFFSETDNGDERGFRFYCVIGKVDTDTPEILCRVGVYGHHMLIPADRIFEVPDVFTDKCVEWQLQDEMKYGRDELSIALEPGISETESGLLVARY